MTGNAVKSVSESRSNRRTGPKLGRILWRVADPGTEFLENSLSVASRLGFTSAVFEAPSSLSGLFERRREFRGFLNQALRCRMEPVLSVTQHPGESDDALGARVAYCITNLEAGSALVRLNPDSRAESGLKQEFAGRLLLPAPALEANLPGTSRPLNFLLNDETPPRISELSVSLEPEACSAQTRFTLGLCLLGPTTPCITLDTTARRQLLTQRPVLDYWKALIEVRRRIRSASAAGSCLLSEDQQAVCLHFGAERQFFAVFHAGDADSACVLPMPRGAWRLILASESGLWGGRGALARDHLFSPGAVRMDLRARAVAVFECVPENYLH